MTETVDQAQAQPPRALAGVIEDATSLSFVPASHFGGSRRWPPCLTAMPYSGKAVTSGSAIPYTTSVDVSLPTHCGHLQQFAGHWRGVPRDAYRVRGTRQGCRADILPGQRSALMPKCSMNHACGPGTTQAITAPSVRDLDGSNVEAVCRAAGERLSARLSPPPAADDRAAPPGASGA
jgi:hypothetical protein